METVTKKTITSLTSDSVSILTRNFATDENGVSEQIGSNHRTAYSNSESGRAFLAENEPEEIVATVLQMWGDTPTIETPELPEYVPNENGGKADNNSAGAISANEFWDEMAAAIEEGVNEV